MDSENNRMAEGSCLVAIKPVSVLAEPTLKPIRRAWQTPYVGDFHRRLLTGIHERMQVNTPFRICEVIQSSGTGKSRVAHELASLVFTIPINLQDITGPHQPLRRILVDEWPNDVNACFWQYIFYRLFSTLAKELDSLASATVTDPKQSQVEFSRMWREHLNNQENRGRIYDEVAIMSSFFLMPFQVIETQALSSLRTLLEKLNRICVIDTTQKVRIVLYIDEAQELAVPFGPDNNPDGYTRIDTLRSVFETFREEPLFCLIIVRQLLLRRPGRP
ncbi:hypothetical protein OG21DRAFT_1556430 [Imleria badia]|nr:hypothetical protein OG21DRAFT_1556430 [Imleria badia]